MRLLLKGMDPPNKQSNFSRDSFLEQLEDHGELFSGLKTYIFSKTNIAFRASDDVAWTLQAQLAKNLVRFAGGQIANDEAGDGITHVVVPYREAVSSAKVTDLARTVGIAWVQKCWDEGTMVDEERFQWG
jgi:DNA ligase-4